MYRVRILVALKIKEFISSNLWYYLCPSSWPLFDWVDGVWTTVPSPFFYLFVRAPNVPNRPVRYDTFPLTGVHNSIEIYSRRDVVSWTTSNTLLSFSPSWNGIDNSHQRTSYPRRTRLKVTTDVPENVTNTNMSFHIIGIVFDLFFSKSHKINYSDFL